MKISHIKQQKLKQLGILNSKQIYQNISTHGCCGSDFITIGDNNLLLVLDRYDNSSYFVNTKIYKWGGNYFTQLQELPSGEAACKGKFFTIDNDVYIALSQGYDETNGRDRDSHIFKWNGSEFTIFQTISGPGVNGMEKFEIGNDHYLMVSHYADASNNTEINSELLKWNGSQFVHHSYIATKGAQQPSTILIDGYTYMCIPNYSSNSSKEITTEIFKWNGSSFVNFQNIATKGAQYCDFANLDGVHYFSIINLTDDSGNQNLTNDIYKWNGSQFNLVQQISCYEGYFTKFVKIGLDWYLSFTNGSDGSTRATDSRTYKWNGSTFDNYLNIPTVNGRYTSIFNCDNRTYLFASNYKDDSNEYNINSYLYRLNLTI